MDLNDPDTWRWIWLVAMVLFGVGEIAMVGSFFLIPFAIGAAVAAVLAFVDVVLGVQWLAFLVVSGVSFLAMRPLARRMDVNASISGIGAHRQVGSDATVVEDVGGATDAGLVMIGAERWRAESVDGTKIPAGSPVVVTEVKGTRVVVEPVPPTNIGDR